MFKDEFPLDPSLIYLNHAAVAPWPARTRDAVKAFADENSRFGATHYPRWLEKEQQLRELMRWLINAPSVDDISIQKSTSEALSVIAHGLPWKSGENVVLYRQEFPSNRIVWQALERYGVEARLVDLDPSSALPEQALFERCDANTRLISVSSVQYGSGIRMDLKEIGQFCHDRGILLCVDAIQSLGAAPLDLQAIGAHFVVADGHKWMLGPEGVALLYTDPAIRPSLVLHQQGWHMLEKTGYFDDLETQPTDSGRRFECGSPNLLGIHALHSSLSLIKEIGLQAIADRISQNSRVLIELIQRRPTLELITPSAPERHCGIITFGIRDRQPEPVYRALMENGVICAARSGGIRFSPHFYIQHHQLEIAMEKLDQVIFDK